MKDEKCVRFVNGPFADGLHLFRSDDEDYIFVATMAERFYLYRYDSAVDAMVYDKEVYMNDEGVVEYNVYVED